MLMKPVVQPTTRKEVPAEPPSEESIKSMSKEDMYLFLRQEMNVIEQASMALTDALSSLKLLTSKNADITFSTLDEVSKFFQTPSVGEVKATMTRIRKILGARAKEKLKELNIR